MDQHGVNGHLWVKFMNDDEVTEEVSCLFIGYGFFTYTKATGKQIGIRVEDVKRYSFTPKNKPLDPSLN